MTVPMYGRPGGSRQGRTRRWCNACTGQGCELIRAGVATAARGFDDGRSPHRKEHHERADDQSAADRADPRALVTARSWDRWVEYYRAKGYEVIVPTYPGIRDRGGGAARKARDHRAGVRPRNARSSQ